MATNEERLEQVAATILDGRVVDWRAAESDVDEEQRRLIKHLKVVAAVAGVHRLPDSWGHLRLIERIGSGSYGDVYRAWDTRLDREVALKLLPVAPSDNRDSSIIHEGRLLARVRHASVVTIHGAEQIDDRIGLWMEFVRGRTLAQMLAEGYRFTTAEAARIGFDLCSAVEAVHAAGLIHRDIKAHNVMLAEDGRIVLMDFGTGRELDDRSGSDLTGTPLYIAPEVLAGHPATARSDVYSLGVLLFHVLTGSYPVRGKSLEDIRSVHASNSRASLREMRPDLSAGLAHAIERAIDPAVDRRPASAAAFGRELNDTTAGLVRRRLLYVAVASTAVLAAAAFTWRDRTPGTQGHVPAIAVLPFENKDVASGSEEFADGLTDEIQRRLAVIDGLALRSSGSSFAFKNRPRDLRDVAAQLDVGYVLEGSVSRANNALRIDARFTRTTGDVVWADSFERDVNGLPAILDDISLAIVNKLRVTLGRGQRRYDLDPDCTISSCGRVRSTDGGALRTAPGRRNCSNRLCLERPNTRRLGQGSQAQWHSFPGRLRARKSFRPIPGSVPRR